MSTVPNHMRRDVLTTKSSLFVACMIKINMSSSYTGRGNDLENPFTSDRLDRARGGNTVGGNHFEDTGHFRKRSQLRSQLGTLLDRVQ